MIVANNYKKYLDLDFKDYTKIPAVINYAKFIKSICSTSKNMFGVDYYVQFDELMREFDGE